jgi:K+-transporting ATPase KdpF subunit
MPATGCEERTMLIEYILGGAVTLGLLVYLTYALLRPERF